MRKFQSDPLLIVTSLVVIMLVLTAVSFAGDGGNLTAYLPVIEQPPPTPTPTPSPTPSPTATPFPPTVEFRGLWVTRFDWTNGVSPAQASKIDEIVNNAAMAGFNAILFQVRGAADAYYTPGLEPWAKRVSGVALGQAPNPHWDPLQYFIAAAHARGIELHAYINVYPVWDQCDAAPPEGVTPTHFYYLLKAAHGTTDSKLNGLQWSSSGSIHCSIYQRSSPASVYADNHYLAVVEDLITRYDIDGVHLDNIRYGGSTVSCDPVSKSAAGVDCFSNAPGGYQSYGDWQRAQVNGTVWKFYEKMVDLNPDLWLTAAVWPSYSSGYSGYYQDSKAWLRDGYIDAIMPMIYTISTDSDVATWQSYAADFQAAHSGRYVIPGMAGGYGTFQELEARINAARELGTAGHAIFSYSSLLSRGYFDDLAAGPYQAPATVPDITWHD